MIVCSCNVLSDRDVRSVVEAQARRSTSQVYGCLACTAKCGRCARTIHSLIEEALGNSCFFHWGNPSERSARRSSDHNAHYSRDTYNAIGAT